MENPSALKNFPKWTAYFQVSSLQICNPFGKILWQMDFPNYSLKIGLYGPPLPRPCLFKSFDISYSIRMLNSHFYKVFLMNVRYQFYLTERFSELSKHLPTILKGITFSGKATMFEDFFKMYFHGTLSNFYVNDTYRIFSRLFFNSMSKRNILFIKIKIYFMWRLLSASWSICGQDQLLVIFGIVLYGRWNWVDAKIWT